MVRNQTLHWYSQMGTFPIVIYLKYSFFSLVICIVQITMGGIHAHISDKVMPLYLLSLFNRKLF